MKMPIDLLKLQFFLQNKEKSLKKDSSQDLIGQNNLPLLIQNPVNRQTSNF
jgi:hypothetical protein